MLLWRAHRKHSQRLVLVLDCGAGGLAWLASLTALPKEQQLQLSVAVQTWEMLGPMPEAGESPGPTLARTASQQAPEAQCAVCAGGRVLAHCGTPKPYHLPLAPQSLQASARWPLSGISSSWCSRLGLGPGPRRQQLCGPHGPYPALCAPGGLLTSCTLGFPFSSTE